MPHLLGLLVEANADVGAGVVAQDRQRPEGVLRGRDSCRPLVGVANIELNRQTATVEARGDRGRFVQEQVGDATRAPSRAKSSACAPPMAPPPPVTSATLPSSRTHCNADSKDPARA